MSDFTCPLQASEAIPALLHRCSGLGDGYQGRVGVESVCLYTGRVTSV